MRRTTKIDSAGRIVIPKELRERYGFRIGQSVKIIPLPDGVSVVAEQNPRKFIQRGPLLTIDTGSGPANLSDFDTDRLREDDLKGKIL